MLIIFDISGNNGCSANAFSCCSLNRIFVIIPHHACGLFQVGNTQFKNCSSLSDVYFAGTDTEWYAISTDIENDPLSRADIHMNAGEP